MRIGLTYDLRTDEADERQAEFDSPETLQALEDALQTLGHGVVRLGGARDLLAAPQRLEEVELVFNLAEGLDGRCREAWVPTLLELHGIPYVGSDPLALSLGLDKVMTKRVAEASGLRTPRWFCVDSPEALPAHLPLECPLIVKPRFEGSGRGIDAGAVVGSHGELRARLGWLFDRCRQPLLIEECIPHGELTVFLIGNESPVAYPAIQRPIDPTSRLSCHVAGATATGWECPLVLDDALEVEARQVARRLFHLIGCRDVARVDLRVDAQGRVYLLEINPLPSYDPHSGLGLLAECLQVSYPELVGRILEAALTRLHRDATPVTSHESRITNHER